MPEYTKVAVKSSRDLYDLSVKMAEEDNGQSNQHLPKELRYPIQYEVRVGYDRKVKFPAVATFITEVYSDDINHPWATFVWYLENTSC